MKIDAQENFDGLNALSKLSFVSWDKGTDSISIQFSTAVVCKLSVDEDGVCTVYWPYSGSIVCTDTIKEAVDIIINKCEIFTAYKLFTLCKESLMRNFIGRITAIKFCDVVQSLDSLEAKKKDLRNCFNFWVMRSSKYVSPKLGSG